MKIKERLLIQFSLIVVSLLLLFTAGVYYFSTTYRESEYYTRLEDRALTSARLLLVEKEGESMIRLLDEISMALIDEQISVYDHKSKLLYKKKDHIPDGVDAEILESVLQRGSYRFRVDRKEALGLRFSHNSRDYIVAVSAYDQYGYSKMNNLRIVLVVEFIIGVFSTLIIGTFFASKALAPISDVINQVTRITGSNLNLRVDEGNRKDEIAMLAITFNQMLQRIEDTFILQKDFVSHAAHELMTPLSVLQAGLDYTLMQQRSVDHYEKVLTELSAEIRKLSRLANGLLDLAISSIDNNNLTAESIRVDEIIVESCNSVYTSNNSYSIDIAFDTLPENEREVTILGNEKMLTIAFKNLIENACKFSESKSVRINFELMERYIIINFVDDGIGIPIRDQEKIFQLFFRGSNTHYIAGYGIGLALTRKIIELHQGDISVKSEINKGSVFAVRLPYKEPS